MRVGAYDLLAIEFEDQAQHTVCGWMLRTKVDGVVTDLALLLVFSRRGLKVSRFDLLGERGVDWY